MPTGYKYVERDAQDTQINWAEVGANFSGMLQQQTTTKLVIRLQNRDKIIRQFTANTKQKASFL